MPPRHFINEYYYTSDEEVNYKIHMEELMLELSSVLDDQPSMDELDEMELILDK